MSQVNRSRQWRSALITPVLVFIILSYQRSFVNGMWLFQDMTTSNQTTNFAKVMDQLATQVPNEKTTSKVIEHTEETASAEKTVYQSLSPFSIAGIRPASIASLLNTVSDTGFSYFNVHDQCRSRTACDVGFMLYKKLNFIHNWIIRASVRSLVDPTNVYSLAWNTGMLGRNCSTVYPACAQSPIESLMSFAFLAS